MNKVFKDSRLDEQFKAEGFLVLDAFDTLAVNKALGEIFNLDPSDNFKTGQLMDGLPPQSYHCTYFDSNKIYKEKVFGILETFFADFIEKYFEDYEPVMANLFLKPPQSGYVTPHQNMTIVDEEKYTSVSIWCPTVDTDITNGTMRVLKGSQKNYAKYRSSSIPWKWCDFFTLSENASLLTPLSVKAGQVVVIDDSIVHTTSSNFTDEPRPVLHAIMAPRNAELLYFEYNNEAGVKKYNVDKNFWRLYTPGDNLGQYIKDVQFELLEVNS